MTDGGTGLFGVVLVLATCSSCPLLPSCGAAVAAGCRSLRSRAACSSVATSGATGCCWLCCCLSGVTLARVVGLCWRHFLLGRRSHRADLHNPIDLCQGALPLGHVFVEASTTRRHDEFAALARRCHSCLPEKWYVSQIFCGLLPSLSRHRNELPSTRVCCVGVVWRLGTSNWVIK